MKGSVVVVPFPFSDLSGSKRRPALVIADWDGDDLILCQITSKANSDGHAIGLSKGDFLSGGLPIDSNIRVNKVFTADKRIILQVAGKLRPDKYRSVVEGLALLIA